MKIHDISPPLSSRLAVWPGDNGLSREVLSEVEKGATVTLSTLRMTVHAGAHTDAPSHYGAGAPSIDAVDLTLYLGPAEVRRVDAPRGARIAREDFGEPPRAERVLLRTDSYPDAESFVSDFNAYSVELVEWLADEGVRLIGIDTPSIDAFDSKGLEVHQVCLARHLGVLEGIVLREVPEGLYELIALPLKLEGFDASPVRAVLRELPGA